MMKTKNDAIWIIKSGTQMLGPFSDQRVIEGIRSREFRAIDEIMKPGGRWSYIRQEPIFTKVVEDVRMGSGGHGDDTTRDTLANTVSQTINITDAGMLDDRTEEISASVIQEAMFQAYDDVNRGGRDRRTPMQNQFTYEGDPEVQQAAKVSTRWVVALTMSLILITVGYVAFNRFVARPIQTQTKIDEDMTMGFEAMDLGDHKMALEKFRAIFEANPEDKGLHTQLAVLEIQIGQQAVVGRRLLENLKNWAGSEKKLILTGLGLAALRDADYTGATTYFQDAASVDSLFVPAEINLGIAALYQKDFANASNYFQLAIKDGGLDNIEVVLLVQSLVALWKTQNDRSFLVEAKKFIDQSIGKESAYLEALLVAGGYVSFKLDQKEEAENYFKRFANRPLAQIERYKADLYVYRDQVSWVNLNQWCLEALRGLDPKAWLIAVESKCLALSGDLMGASGRIDQAIEQAPRDALVQALYADLLNRMNSTDRAKVSVEKAVDFDDAKEHLLPRIQQAELCHTMKDAGCSQKYWKEILQAQPNSVIAISGLAWSYFSEGKYEEARQYLSMGKRLESQYIPFLKLQKSLARIDQKRGL